MSLAVMLVLTFATAPQASRPANPSTREVSVRDRVELADYVVIIGRLGDPASRDLMIQDFVIGGENVIPIFTDTAAFKAQTAGSGFEAQGIEIKTRMLADMLRGNEVLVLDPGSDRPRRFLASELKRSAVLR